MNDHNRAREDDTDGEGSVIAEKGVETNLHTLHVGNTLDMLCRYKFDLKQYDCILCNNKACA